MEFEKKLKYSLTFRVDFNKSWNDYSKSLNKEEIKYCKSKRKFAREEYEHKTRRKLYNSIGLKLFSYAWAEVDITGESIKLLNKFFDDLSNENIGYPGDGYLFEHLEENELKSVEWYIIGTPSTNIDFSLWSDYPECRAYKHSPFIHIQERHFISEKFRKVVEKNNLTGLEFLWINDKGKYKANQWYSAIAHNPIGHGIDHPWVSFEKHKQKLIRDTEWIVSSLEDNGLNDLIQKERSNSEKEREIEFGPVFRRGISSFGKSACIDGKPSDVTLREFLKRFPNSDSGLKINGVKRFLNKTLPSTDFGYFWNCIDGINPERKMRKFRNLCVNRKAKEILLNNRLITDKQCEPVIIYENVPYKHKLIDSKSYPGPVWSEEEMIILRKKEKTLIEKFKSKDLLIRKPSLNNSIKLLRQSKKERPGDFKKGMPIKKLESANLKLSYKLPGDWLSILLITNGGYLNINNDTDCEVVPIAQIDEFNKELVQIRCEDSDDFINEYTYFAKDICGNSYAFNKKPNVELQNCGISLISHEDFTIQMNWESIEDFIESIIVE